MTADDFLKSPQNGNETIANLKKKQVSVPSWCSVVKEYDSSLHPVCDKAKRPDKEKKDRVEEVSRLHLNLEQLITTRMVEFLFAIPVKRIYIYDEQDEELQGIVKAIEAVYSSNRIDTHNLERGKMLLASCECATLWYTTDNPNKKYGFDSKKKLKCKSYSPMTGFNLYPIFDSFGDLIIMSVEYAELNFDDSDVIFETYTADRHLRWRNERLEIDEPNTLGKIPFVYSSRRAPIWDGVQHLVNEIELTLSRNSDVIAYNASPILAVSGDLKGSEDKGEGRRIFRVENGGSVGYVSWSQAIEAVKYQVETLLRLLWMQVQLPDLSFENIKGLGAVSGEARKTLLTDAHLKVGDEKGAFLEIFDRETNIIKAELAMLNPKWADRIDEIEVEHIVTAFVQNDETTEIQKWITANGGKPIVSQLESIKYAGISGNPIETMNNIKAEQLADTQMQQSAFTLDMEG